MLSNTLLITELPLKINIHIKELTKNAKLMEVTSRLRAMTKLILETAINKKNSLKNNQLQLPLMLADGHHTVVVSSQIVELP
jgi:hypothetical protein